MSERTLLRGGCVLALGERTSNHTEADVLLDGDRIAEIGPRIRVRDAEVVDASGCIVLPGFVDAHRHLWRTLLRQGGATDPGPGADPIATIYGARYRPDDLYAATLLGLLTALQCGVTTVVDWCEIAMDAPALEAVIQAHRDAAVRTVLVHGEHPASVVAPSPAAPSAGYGSPDPATTDLTQLAALWSTARGAGLRIHAHLGTRPGDRGTAVRLREEGLLGPDVTLAHCTMLEGDDLDAIAATGAAVVLTPAHEMGSGIGPPPVQSLIDRDIRPGLGIEDEIVAPGDLLSQMRAVQSVQHATYFDRKLAGKGGLPNLLTTREVIRWATLAGARAVGLDGVTGSLEVGKQADVLVLRGDLPNIHPVNDPIGAVVWGVEPTNVDWVFVSGRARVRSGELQADVARVRSLATVAHRHVAGLEDDLVDARTADER